MEKTCISLFLLQSVSTVFLCCYLQNACGDHICVMESATCVAATVDCFMDHNGVLANQALLDQYEQDTGCSTTHLAIWLWGGEPYTCIFKNGTDNTRSEVRGSTSDTYVSSSTSQPSKMLSSITAQQETHRYICVTNGMMSNGSDLCQNELQILMMETEQMYINNKIIGSCVATSFIIIATLILVGLYKRRTRERPTAYWPHSSNRSENDTETLTINDAHDTTVTHEANAHHYTLPKTTSCLNVVKLVLPALRKTNDGRAWASEANIYSLPYLTSGTRSGAVSNPEIHLYDDIEPYARATHHEKKYRCLRYTSVHKQDCHTDKVHDYLELCTTPVAASAPDLHMYAELKLCNCVDKPGKACNCIKYTSICQQNDALDEFHDNTNIRIISESASAPDLHIYADLGPCDFVDDVEKDT